MTVTPLLFISLLELCMPQTLQKVYNKIMLLRKLQICYMRSWYWPGKKNPDNWESTIQSSQKVTDIKNVVEKMSALFRGSLLYRCVQFTWVWCRFFVKGVVLRGVLFWREYGLEKSSLQGGGFREVSSLDSVSFREEPIVGRGWMKAMSSLNVV